MSESMEDKIARLKREYRMAEQALEFRKLLGQKRDELENSIEDLKKEIEAEKFKTFRNKNLNGENAKSQDKVQLNTDLLNSVKSTQKELDAKLDEYELYSTEMLFSLREELILSILELHPVKKAEFENLQREVQNKLIFLERINTIDQANKHLLEEIKAIATERKSVQRQNLLRYVFGTNPNIAITNSLMKIDRTISDSAPVVEKTLPLAAGIKNLESLLNKNKEIFAHLQELSRSRWGWKKLDREIIPYQEKLEELNQKFSENINHIEFEIQDLRQRIDSWIDHKSK